MDGIGHQGNITDDAVLAGTMITAVAGPPVTRSHGYQLASAMTERWQRRAWPAVHGPGLPRPTKPFSCSALMYTLLALSRVELPNLAAEPVRFSDRTWLPIPPGSLY